jgi:membrane-associated phospholipid phosphatase
VLFSGLVTVSLVRLLYLLLIEPDGLDRGARWWRWVVGSIAGRLTLALVLLSIAIVVCALALDRPVAIWAHALPSGVQLVMSWITQLGVSTGWLIASGVPVILFWLLRARLPDGARQRWQSYVYVPLFAFTAIAGAGLANSLIKAVAGRFRPKLFFLDQHYGFDLWHRASDYTSFPSGHTAVIFAVATVVSLVWRRLAWPAFAVAALVGLSRVLVGAHWPSDVLAGAWLGVAWTLWVRHLFVSRGAAPSEALAGRAAWRGPLFRVSLAWSRRKASTTPCATVDR